MSAGWWRAPRPNRGAQQQPGSAPQFGHFGLHPGAVLGISSAEVRHRPGDDVVFRHLCQTVGDAIYQALLFVGAHQAIQVARLNEIVVLGVQVRLVVARRAIGGHRGVGGTPVSTGPSKLLGS